MRIDQLVPAFHRGDAIGDTAFHMRDLFRRKGHEANIYCLDRDEGLAEESVFFKDFPPPTAGDVTILHFALPSPLSPAFARLASRKILLYHNITPAHYFLPYSREMAHMAHVGRRELASLVGTTDLGLADSEFNRQELGRLGFRRTEVFPLYVDFAKYERPADRFLQDLVKDGRTNILFVGRIVPNKKIEDLIKVTFYFKKYISPLVRLLVVGKTLSLPNYYHSLIRLADEFYLKSEEVQFTGHIPDEEMYALYRASDVFLSLSEHEGFCLPLLESMVFDLPVVAYAAGAVPGTLGGAGVLIRDRRVDRVAELVDILSRAGRLREEIVGGQRRRLEEFKKTDWGARLLEWLTA
jgi:glycosyltransferase involved in cell wall biosynthesis